MKLLFKEEQKFTQWWLWLILIGVGIISIWGIYQQIIVGKPFGNNPMSDTGLIIFSILNLALIILFYSMQLKMEIDQNEIRIEFFPFAKRTVKWTDIRNAKIVNYGFVGGWGIRYSTKYGKVYNVRGNKGLAIKLNNGKKFLVGTQKEAELKLIIEKYIQ